MTTFSPVETNGQSAANARGPADRDAVLATAHECGRYIWARNPYVRMIAVSGSLTRPEHDASHDDADYFVITQRGRVWEAFFGCLFHGWRYARRRGMPRKFFCFNYLVDESHLEEIDLSRREYVVEFLRLDLVAGHRVYRELLDRLRPRLEGCEPQLYRQAKERTDEAIRLGAKGEPGPSRPGATEVAWAWRLFYRVGKLPFMVLARRMESRRKRSYPGGHIYSNRRAIRSHFRRGWGADRSYPDAMPASQAFTNLAATYDEKVVASPANQHMRSVVWQTLAPLVRPGTRVLDLGCGTGVDTAWLAQRGASVVAVDVAPGMVDVTRRRVADAGMTDRVVVQRVAIESLADLLPAHARRFDIVLANFGALNMAGDTDRWCPIVARLLKPGGHLIATVVNRVSVWELVAGIARLRFSYALRRLHGDPVVVGAIVLAPRLYSPASFVRSLKGYFRAERVSGLCSFVPPPDLERLGRIIPAQWRLLAWLDLTFGSLPGIRAAGDHFLVVMRATQAPIFDRQGFGSVTAAPVVADVNGDGAPEVLIAARRMHVVDSHGFDLPGWPRRIGGPLASTPAVAGAGPEATVFVGSDDHRLYAIGLDGKARHGFPIRTGGDVFSSPLTHLPDRISFGSDDGRIYAIDRSGNPAPGWPFETGGFVSASSVQLRVGGETAIAIGSWDGNLYVLDRDGRKLPGWPVNLGSAIWSSAAVADIDGDGHPEIAVATDRLFVLRPDATSLAGFPASLDAYAVGSPAIGDIDRDGRLEIVVASDRVYAFRDDGCPLKGFPVEVGAYVWASPILVDVDGDGHPEIVIGDFKGRLWAITHSGEVVNGYPKKLGARIVAAPTAADLDGDGFLELIVATSDGRLIALSTECANNVNLAPWPSFLAGRTTFHRPASVRNAAAHLGNGSSISGNGSSTTDNGSSTTGDTSSNPSIRSDFPIDRHPRRQVSVRGRPYGVSEVSLALSAGTRATGMLYYFVDGRMHPSPLLKNGERHVSLIQPLPLLKAVTFSLRLRVDGNEMRVPQRGVYRFRAGVPGLSLDVDAE